MALRAIYYDTETTGVNAKNDRVIELAAYDPLNDTTFHALLNPGMPIPPDSTAIHNITDEMVKDAPTFAEKIDEFLAFCSGESVLIAHNNDGFDKHFLHEEFMRAERGAPPFRYLDTLKWARKYRPDLPRHSLQFLREIYGFEANNAHRALDDVIMLHQIFSEMIDDLDLETIIKLLESNGGIDRMPFGKYRGKPLEEVPQDYLAWLLESGALDKPQNAELKEALEKAELLPEPSAKKA